MSNRDGKTAKHAKTTWRKGALCKKCGKGHYEYCKHKGCKALICKTCGTSSS